MEIEELIAKLVELQKQNPGAKMMVSSGGMLADLQVGPLVQTITEEHADDSGDCEDRVGERVVVLG